MKYKVLTDGSLLFEKDLKFQSSSYTQDPNNPLRFIPKYEPCRFRELIVFTKPCGWQVSDWKCNLYNKNVSVKICRNCETRQE